jgi:hypothetical protein
MINKKMTFISAQPDVPYFHWQVEVFIHNAMKSGVNPNWIEILFAYDETPSDEGVKLAQKYPFIRFFFYKKTGGENYGYIPILRPDILEQHFFKYPELSNEIIFYHDSDIIFRELPNFNLLNDDDVWYLSDTVSYIGSDYIKSKSDKLLTDMCNIAGVSRELVERNNENSGGAQYLMKNIDHLFWRDVKFVSLDLYKYMLDAEVAERSTLTEEELKTYNPIQKWCSDMWAVLWCAWKRGHQTRISMELNFGWGSGGSHEWDSNKIMHNAGVLDSEKSEKFYKGEYISKSPFGEDFSFVKPENNSWNYVQAILYAAEQRKDL